MITLTVRDLLNMKDVLQAMANTPMAAKDSLNMYRMLKVFDKEYEGISETQANLLKKYVAKEGEEYLTDKNGNYVIDADKIGDYNREAIEFLNTTIEFNINPLSWNAVESMKLTPNQISTLEKIMEE